MEVSGANIIVGNNGGNVGSGVARSPSPSRPQPYPPSRHVDQLSLTISTTTLPTILTRRSTLPLPIPRMGSIQIGVDDTGGLMDGPHEVDAS